MAKKKATQKEEELNNEQGNDGNSGRDASSSSSGEQGGVEGGGTPSGASGGVEGASGGVEGGNQDSSSGGDGSGQGVEGGSRASEKLDLLQRIRSKRSNGLSDTGSPTNGTGHADSQADGRGLSTGKRGTKTDDGATPRADSGNRLGGGQGHNSSGGTREITSGNDASRVKQQGVNIKGVDKIKQLAQAATQAQAPKIRFSWDEKPLSNKEGEEMQPKIRALLEFIFRHMDKGISISNRNKAEAHVWRSIDDEDLDIIASHLVEMGKASKVVATAVRRMTNSYRLLQIGLITLPKFIQTYQFYAANGGFSLAASTSRG